MPRSRSHRFAASKSPSVSWSARLQSIIGAPVSARSCMTSFAGMSAIGDLLHGSSLCLRLGSGLRLGLGFGLALHLALRHLLLAGVDRVGEHARHERARADRVVVAGDDV